MDRFHWLWLLGFCNSLGFFLLCCRAIWLRKRIDSVNSTVTYLVFCHRDHVHDNAVHTITAHGCKEVS